MTRRERLAIAMGWYHGDNAWADGMGWNRHGWRAPEGWRFPKRVQREMGDLIFDPENNDTDAMALREWLNSQGKIVRIETGPEFCNSEVRIWHFGMARGNPEIWTGNDYKEGLAELAEKIIER